MILPIPLLAKTESSSQKQTKPGNRNHTVKSFLDVLGRDLNEFPTNNEQNKFIKKNVSKAEDYIAEAQRQWNDTTFYEKLDNDPPPAYNNMI